MTLLLLLSALFSPSAQAQHAGQPVPVYRVSHTAAAIDIDGALAEFDWSVAQRIRFVKLRHEPEDSKPLRQETQVAALWDDQNLYLAFIVADREIWASLRTRDARLFPEECIEFFIDPDSAGRHYTEAQINSVGNMRDLLVDYSRGRPTLEQFDVMAKWDYQHVRKAVKVHRDGQARDLGWTLELAIPWTEFRFAGRSFPPPPGDEIRINFYRYERARDGHLPLELSGWSPVQATFHDPPRFGRFIFSARGVSAER